MFEFNKPLTSSWVLSYSSEDPTELSVGTKNRNYLYIQFGKLVSVKITLPGIVKSKLLNPDVPENKRNYWDYSVKKYGISLMDNFINLYYGTQLTHIKSKTKAKSKSFLMGWKVKRLVKHEIYDNCGYLFWRDDTLESKKKRNYSLTKILDQCPPIVYVVKTEDNDQVIAKVYVEVREWKRGVGRFKWVGDWISKKKSQSLIVRFDRSIKLREGTIWKGDEQIILPIEIKRSTLRYKTGEDLICTEVFKDFCKNNNLTYVKRIGFVPELEEESHVYI